MNANRFTFRGHNGYLIGPSAIQADHNLLALGHTAGVHPWRDPGLHAHTGSLDFPTPETANAGLGTRHRLHYHRLAWEYYLVLQGEKTLQVEA